MTSKQFVKSKFPKAKAVKVRTKLYTVWQIKMGISIIAEDLSAALAWGKAKEKLTSL